MAAELRGPVVSYHDHYRLTIEREDKGYTILIEGAGLRRKFGHFPNDWDAHAAAVGAIDEQKRLAEKQRRSKFDRFANEMPPDSIGPETFGSRLRWARRIAKMSIARFAANVRKHSKIVNQWESGQRFPSWEETRRCAHVLDCNARWLHCGEGTSEMIWGGGK